MLQIEIPNWDKFNPRSDRANYTWFRLQNDFFYDQSVFCLSAEQRGVYLFCLCEASKKNQGVIELRAEFIGTILRMTPEHVIRDLKEIHKLKLLVVSIGGQVTADSRHDDGEQPADSRHQVSLLPATYERTNETNERDVSATPTAGALPRLAKIWNENCDTLPKVKACGGTRKRAAESRWREKPDEAYWTDVVTRIKGSPFCRGNNSRSWRADFDFLIRPETQHKVLEGKYDDKGSTDAFDWNKVFGGVA